MSRNEEQKLRNGLRSSEAAKRLSEYGYNELEKKKENKELKILIQQVTRNPIIYVLLIAAVLSYFSHEEINSYAIFFVIFIVIALGFFPSIKLIEEKINMTEKGFIQRFKKWSLTVKILPIVLFIVCLKFIVHFFGFEIIESNPYLTSLIAATVFLMGFLITGVLSDYKESEKLPAELAMCMETMADEAYIIYKNKKAPEAREFIVSLLNLSKKLEGWFYKKSRTIEVMRELRLLNDGMAKLEPLTQPAFISRLKQEQNNTRRIVTRIHSIRDTSFISSGYAIAEGISALLIIALLLTRFEPFLESLFFVIPVIYLFVYMIALIRDLDNPFDYTERGESAEEVSLKEVHTEVKRLEERLVELDLIDKSKN